MFAGVKFLSDDTVGVVPIYFVKNFKLPVDTSKTVQVFWSKNPDEEPNSSHKNMDKTYKNLSQKDQKGSLPPSGYFNDKVLCIADTFTEASESLNNLGLPLVKRIKERVSKTAANRLISSAASAVVRSSMLYENSLTFTDDIDNDDSDVDETVEPVKVYKEKIKCMESTNSHLEEEVASLKLELKEAKEQLRKAEGENLRTSEKLKRAKGKYRELKNEFKTVRELNYELQKKLIASFDDVVPKVSEQNNSVLNDTDPLSESLISPNSLPLECSRKRPNDVFEPAKKIQKLSKEISSTPDPSDIIEETQDIIFETQPMAVAPLNNSRFYLSDDIVKTSSIGCRTGKDGDKVYVKNLAVNLFGSDVLINSSVTGRKPPTGGGKPPRPALPKEGIDYIKHLLENRVQSELKQKDITEEEKKVIIDQRSSFLVVVQAIGDKIATLRRGRK